MTATTTDSVYGKAYGGSAPENYQRYFVPVIGGPFAEDLIAEAALRPGERVLDVACGTGVVARLAAERVGPSGTVAALDLNPAMLSVARSVPSTGAAIRWYETSAESIPLPDDAFESPTRLGGWRVAELVAHLTSNVTAMGRYLRQPAPPRADVELVRYYQQARAAAAGVDELVERRKARLATVAQAAWVVEPDPRQRRAAAAHVEQLVNLLLVLDDRERHVGVGDRKDELAGGGVLVERHRDRADRLRRQHRGI